MFFFIKFLEEDLLINPKDYQEAKEGDIVEIFHPSEDDNPRLLLQIKAFKDDLSSKGQTLIYLLFSPITDKKLSIQYMYST